MRYIINRYNDNQIKYLNQQYLFYIFFINYIFTIINYYSTLRIIKLL